MVAEVMFYVAPFGRVSSFSPNSTAGLPQSAGPATGDGIFRTQPSRSVSWFILPRQAGSRNIWLASSG